MGQKLKVGEQEQRFLVPHNYKWNTALDNIHREKTMEYRGLKITLAQGDIALERADALVNAANSALAGGGGVDGAIHRRGGKSIMAETDRLYPNGCPTGSAVISGAGELDARYVIHAVAPRWSNRSDSAALLASAYRTSLELAAKHGCQSVAFPSLGTGAYRYPVDKAAQIALETVKRFIDENQNNPDFPLKEIRFVLFDDSTRRTFQKTAAENRIDCQE